MPFAVLANTVRAIIAPPSLGGLYEVAGSGPPLGSLPEAFLTRMPIVARTCAALNFCLCGINATTPLGAGFADDRRGVEVAERGTEAWHWRIY